MFKLVHYVKRALGIQMKCLLVPKWFNCHVICLHVQYSTNVADGNEEVPKKWREKLHGKSIEDVYLMLLSHSLRCVECNTVTFLLPGNEVWGKLMLYSRLSFCLQGRNLPPDRDPLDRDTPRQSPPELRVLSDRDPLNRDFPGQRPPGQRYP